MEIIVNEINLKHDFLQSIDELIPQDKLIKKNLKRSIDDYKKNEPKRIKIEYENKFYNLNPNDQINNLKKGPRNNPRRNDPKDPKKDETSKKDPIINPKKDPITRDQPTQHPTAINLNNNDNFFSLLNILLTDIPDAGAPTSEPDICKNPLCNHKTFEEDPTSVQVATISKVNDIEDLIKLGKTYHCKKNKDYYGLNLRILCNLVLPLTELRNMIGLKSVKTHIVNQILFFLRGYNKNNRCNECIDCSYSLPCARNLDDMLHTVITGPPGVGKTHLGKILCKIYKEAGILSKGHFTLVTRSDFIAKYLGQTAIKTQKLIDRCIGGVMFIDEAYALGHSEGRDSFSKECLDTLNQNLSEKRDLLCIIAGYKGALDKCFFSMNDGLVRRFTFRYDIEGYTSEELMEIFLLKISQGSWQTEFTIKEGDNEKTKESKGKQNNKLSKFFKDHKDDFPNYGGDIETLFLNCKIAHCRKIPLYVSKHKKDTNEKIITVTEEITREISHLAGENKFVPHQIMNDYRNPLINNQGTSIPNNVQGNNLIYNNRILSLKDIYDGFDMYLSFKQGGNRQDKYPPLFMYI